MDETEAKKLGLICVACGPPRASGDHFDCPVIVRHESQVKPEWFKNVGALPALCECDCRTCKHRWWDMGRPTRQNGKIATQSGKVLA